ncbi:hypothetical protein GGF32_005021 [Allomyces javanicus]|nr:hypothetical protein GGF32_005021 [Allomyces javanicus]
MAAIGVSRRHAALACTACQSLWRSDRACCVNWDLGLDGHEKRSVVVGLRRDTADADADASAVAVGEMGDDDDGEVVVMRPRVSRARRSAHVEDDEDDEDDGLDDALDDEYLDDGDREEEEEEELEEGELNGADLAGIDHLNVVHALDRPSLPTPTPVSASWPPTSSTVRKQLAASPFSRLLLSPASPLIVTGDDGDAVATSVVRAALGIKGATKKIPCPPAAAMAAIGVVRTRRRCCLICDEVRPAEESCRCDEAVVAGSISIDAIRAETVPHSVVTGVRRRREGE